MPLIYSGSNRNLTSSGPTRLNSPLRHEDTQRQSYNLQGDKAIIFALQALRQFVEYYPGSQSLLGWAVNGLCVNRQGPSPSLNLLCVNCMCLAVSRSFPPPFLVEKISSPQDSSHGLGPLPLNFT